MIASTSPLSTNAACAPSGQRPICTSGPSAAASSARSGAVVSGARARRAWRGLLRLLWGAFGLAAIAGSYETLHIIDFAGLFANLPMAAAGTLLAAAVGFTAASLFAPSVPAQGSVEPVPAHDELADAELRVDETLVVTPEREAVLV